MAIKTGALLYIESSRGTRAFEGDTINITIHNGQILKNALIDRISEQGIEIHPNIRIFIEEIADFAIQNRAKRDNNRRRKVRIL